MLAASLLINIANVGAASSMTITATSCSVSAVQSAVALANDGDIVIIPAETCVWSTGITINNKAISIIGADRNSTIITDATGSTQQLFMVTTQGKKFRLSNMTIGGNPNDYDGHIKIGASNYRIDHITFTTTVDRTPLSLTGSGLVDNCIFGLTGRVANVYASGATAIWSNASSYAPGTGVGVYFEDCDIYGHAIDSLLGNDGAIYVLRYSHIYNGAHLDLHGGDSNNRSGLFIEVYGNIFSNSGSLYYTAINMRGGSAIIFDNVFDVGKYGAPLRLINYRTCYNTTKPPNSISAWNSGSTQLHVINQNRCEGGSQSVNPLDTNSDSTGWPCKDQIGRGPNQVSKPSYEWNNKWSDGSDVNFSVGDPWGCTNPSMADHIKSGRDFYNDTPAPGYTPYGTYTNGRYYHPLSAPYPPGNVNISN